MKARGAPRAGGEHCWLLKSLDGDRAQAFRSASPEGIRTLLSHRPLPQPSQQASPGLCPASGGTSFLAHGHGLA